MTRFIIKFLPINSLRESAYAIVNVKNKLVNVPTIVIKIDTPILRKMVLVEKMY